MFYALMMAGRLEWQDDSSGRTRKDVPGSGRDMCRDMDAIQTPHSNLVGFYRTSINKDERRAEDSSW